MHPTNTGGPPTPKSSFRHRIPTSLRQHWKLLAVFVAFVAIMATVFGNTRIRPYITGDATVIASEITENIAGTVDLFDASVTHEVAVDIPDAALSDMLTAYQNNGEKDWVNATVTIDGTVITDVGVRFKGNSTLSGLRGDGGFGGGPPEGVELPEGVEPAGFPMPGGTQDATTETGDTAETDGGMGGGGGGMGGPGGMSSVSADDPTTYPLLLAFDQFTEGRAYQGLTEISVRPGTPVLNEAMALSLTTDTDQPTQRYTYSVYSINDSATTTRLLLEHPDDGYANSLFDTDGYLYKADASSRFAYVDDDQSSYSDQFKQINAAGSGNLQPIINFLKWLDSASDEEFDEQLGAWVDVESFARYVATQNLLVNGDDMAGPGQNYYLWYDFESGVISVVSWDLNLAMTGGTTAGPQDTVSMGGGGRPGAAAGAATTDTATTDQQAPTGQATAGQAPTGTGQQAPTGQRPGRGQAGAGTAQVPGGGMMPGGNTGDNARAGGMRGGNTLKTRFLASDAFTELYESAYWELFDQMYGSGRAQEILDGLAETVPTSDGLTAESLQSSVDTMRTWIDQRTTALTELRSA